MFKCFQALKDQYKVSDQLLGVSAERVGAGLLVLVVLVELV